MKLIIGLGNPGKKYAKTRHNAGYILVDKLHSMVSSMTDIVLLKPGTSMNKSGQAVKKLVDSHKTAMGDLYIIHDDLDIKLGEYKIQKGKGPKDHKGVNSIEDSLGETDFWRIRIGVENRESEKRISGEEYVLQEFDGEELEIIGKVADEVIKDLQAR